MERFKKISRVLTGIFMALATLALVPEVSAAEETDWPEPVDDNQVFSFLLVEQLELRTITGMNMLRWDLQGWVGTDTNKFWVKAEGEADVSGGEGGDAELQLLYSRMIAPFWDFQAGIRYDRTFGAGPDQDRGFLVLGFQGLSPYKFEVEPVLFISQNGDVSARLTASYELLLSQKIVLQPRFETNFAIQRVRPFDVGKGLNDIQIGIRLRYEIKREFAPYIGFSWFHRFGDTAAIVRSKGEKPNYFTAVFGLRMWF
ncbi:MAG: copper resistance protein B [Sphingomonadales bacterium]